MKRTARALLAAVLAVALALPAAAADPTDQRMTQVTQAVKEQLNIGDSYIKFYGDLTENEFNTYWTLNWEKEGETLRVEAGEDGTIYSYDLRREEGYAYPTDSDSTTAFPTLSRAEALPYAQAFADQVLHAPESVKLTAQEESGQVGARTYGFQAQLLLYGLSSPIGVWVEVDTRDGTVVGYQRDDLYQTYLNEPIDPAPYGDMADKASSLLKGTLKLKLEYVPDESDPGRAVLRYVPVYGDDYYVDAATGKLVNLTQLYQELEKGEGDNGATGGAESGDGSNSLTDVEQEGIAQMAGVWSKEDLDKKARTFAPLKLDGWTLYSCSYQLNRESGEVKATLRYTRDQEGSSSRTITLDGKTGALLSASGYAWTEEDYTPAVSQQTAQKTAEDFLASLWGEQWKSCALYESTSAGDGNRVHVFTFAQKVNGYFYPTNSITVGVDSADGTILRLSRSFDSTPTFDDPAGVITEQAALDAWFATYTVTPGYTAVPRRLDRYGSQYQDLIARGYLADLSQEEAADQVYDQAVSMGLITRSQRQDDKLVTRAELTRVLLDWGGYGNAAIIPGIFQCSYTDRGDIPAEYYGYAAIAQGLGMVQGDTAGRFLPNRTATRLEAVVMLYQLMDR